MAEEVYSEELGRKASLDERMGLIEANLRYQQQLKVITERESIAHMSGLWQGFLFGFFVGGCIFWWLNTQDRKADSR